MLTVLQNFSAVASHGEGCHSKSSHLGNDLGFFLGMYILKIDIGSNLCS